MLSIKKRRDFFFIKKKKKSFASLYGHEMRNKPLSLVSIFCVALLNTAEQTPRAEFSLLCVMDHQTYNSHYC